MNKFKSIAKYVGVLTLGFLLALIAVKGVMTYQYWNTRWAAVSYCSIGRNYEVVEGFKKAKVIESYQLTKKVSFPKTLEISTN